MINDDKDIEVVKENDEDIEVVSDNNDEDTVTLDNSDAAILEYKIESAKNNLNNGNKELEVNRVNDYSNNNNNNSTRKNVDDTINNAGSSILQKMGVPKGVSDKAVKSNGGPFSPFNLPGNKLVSGAARDKIGKTMDKSGMSQRLNGLTSKKNLLSNIMGNKKEEEANTGGNTDSNSDTNEKSSKSSSDSVNTAIDTAVKVKKISKVMKFETIGGGCGFVLLILLFLVVIVSYMKLIGIKASVEVASSDNNIQSTLEDNSNKVNEDLNIDDLNYIDVFDNYSDDSINVKLIAKSGDLSLDDLIDAYGKSNCSKSSEVNKSSEAGKVNGCVTGAEKRFFLKMYDLYYLYLAKYHVKLDLSLIMAALTYKTFNYDEMYIYNLSWYDRETLVKSDWGRLDYDGSIGLEWDYDYEHPDLLKSSYLVMNDASTDMQVLAKNMVTKITDQKCKTEDGKISKSEKVKDYEADLVCNEGEQLEKGDSTYKLDLDKFDDFLLEFINKKYYDGKIGFPGWILGIADLYDNPEKKTPSLIRIIDNESGSSSKKGSLVNNSDIVEQLNSKAISLEGNSGYEYRRFIWPGGEGDYLDWCAAFVSYLFDETITKKTGIQIISYAGGAGDIPRLSINGKYGGTWLEDECTDPTSVPQAGDIILFDPWFDGYGYVSWPENQKFDSDNDKYLSSHVGYIYKVTDEYVYTVEGNTGGGDGIVNKKQYSRKTHCGNSNIQGINGYFRPNYGLLGNNSKTEEKSNTENDVIKSTSSSSSTGGVTVSTANGFKNIIYYNQYDYYGYSYGYVGSIASHGCGPTSLAIVISSILQEEHSPVELTNYMCEHYVCDDGGSRWQDIPAIEKDYANKYGFKTAQISDLNELRRMLSSGNALAVTITNGGFTTNSGNLISSGGHYFVLTGVASDGNVTIVDPANSANTNRTVNLEVLAAHNHNSSDSPSFWVVYK